MLRKCEWDKDDYSLNVANLSLAHKVNARSARKEMLAKEKRIAKTDGPPRMISQLLSLRKPRTDSLEILGEILERATIGKEGPPRLDLENRAGSLRRVRVVQGRRFRARVPVALLRSRDRSRPPHTSPDLLECAESLER